jgi:hypothetical protein
MSHTTNAKRLVANDETASYCMRSVAKMNWKTNKPNPYNLPIDEINKYKTMIRDTVCNGSCCQ